MLMVFIEASTWASNYATHTVCATADITFLTMKLGSQGAEVALDSSNDLSISGYPWHKGTKKRSSMRENKNESK